MRIAKTLAGAFLLLSGGVWFLQGINMIPGSFMTGQPMWAVYGAISAIIGAIVIYRANRPDSNSKLP
jgi:hypothetical protein